METEAPVQVLTPTPATEWKGKAQLDGTDLPLPSGNVARVRKISPQAFLTSGVIPDPLSDIVEKAIHTKKGLPPSKVKQMAQDPEKIQASLELFDKVLCWVTIMPEISMPPTCTECGEYFNVDNRHNTNVAGDDQHRYVEGPRLPAVLYADQVDLADKVFIFQYCLTGARDLETFRQRFQGGLGGLLDGQDVPVSPQQPA